MMSDLGERLRRANPAPFSAPPAVADEELLQRLLAEPRMQLDRAGRRLPGGRAAVLIAAAVLLLGGLAAAASRLAVEYFGADDREPTPAEVVAAFELMENPEVDAERYVRVAAFDGPQGHVTIYAARSRDGKSFCVADYTGDGTFIGSGCSEQVPDEGIPWTALDDPVFGEAKVLLGLMEAGTSRIDVYFEDETMRAASIREPFWTYVVSGEETEPGHRPVLVEATRGAVVVDQEIDRYFFTNRDAAMRALPETDGSAGQEAIRRTLELLLPYGHRYAEQVDLGSTRLLRRIETAAGSVEIHVATFGRDGLCYGYAPRDVDLGEIGTIGCPENDSVRGQPRRLDREWIEVYALVPGIWTIDGTPPVGTSSLTITFEDGASAPVDILRGSFFTAWLGPDRLEPGRRPVELEARDGDGRLIDVLALDPARFRPAPMAPP